MKKKLFWRGKADSTKNLEKHLDKEEQLSQLLIGCNFWSSPRITEILEGQFPPMLIFQFNFMNTKAATIHIRRCCVLWKQMVWLLSCCRFQVVNCSVLTRFWKKAAETCCNGRYSGRLRWTWLSPPSRCTTGWWNRFFDFLDQISTWNLTTQFPKNGDRDTVISITKKFTKVKLNFLFLGQLMGVELRLGVCDGVSGVQKMGPAPQGTRVGDFIEGQPSVRSFSESI